ncbi:pre-mRNA-splicing factor CWC22 [Tanacetum coccineum]|uniref:Pre-mRNA-splicing factor CWC22 n=1 Tax=Tanacetum coccineum TaxID=301880 RepID=A0ABQ4WN19_9ASTR
MYYSNVDMIMEDNKYVMYDKGLQRFIYDSDSSQEQDYDMMSIKDDIRANRINLRRVMYETIMSSHDFEETGHKLMELELQPSQELDLCIMIIECCSMEISYRGYYGLLAQRLCLIDNVYKEVFEKLFVQQYLSTHCLEKNKLRNIAKFFAHLLATNGLSWHVLGYIRLTENDTTSTSRTYIKILFQELRDQLGDGALKASLSDPRMQAEFESIFPRDDPRNTRFSINFFTSIGLGDITDNLKDYLKTMSRPMMLQSESDRDFRRNKRRRAY